MQNTFPGHCPICSEQLLWDDNHPGTAYCPKQHYSCDVKKFDQLWNDFDAQVKRLGMDRAVAAYAEKLLKDLRALNVAKGKAR